MVFFVIVFCIFSIVFVIVIQLFVFSNLFFEDYYFVEDVLLLQYLLVFIVLLLFKFLELDWDGIVFEQEVLFQECFVFILLFCKLEEWLFVLLVDIIGVVEIVGDDQVGMFLIVEMKKVDMKEYNEGKLVYERWELFLYWLLKLLLDDKDVKSGYDVNVYVLVYVFVVDRNGLLMVGNYIGLGYSLGRVVSLSYYFVMYVEVKVVVMREEDGWWI